MGHGSLQICPKVLHRRCDRMVNLGCIMYCAIVRLCHNWRRWDIPPFNLSSYRKLYREIFVSLHLLSLPIIQSQVVMNGMVQGKYRRLLGLAACVVTGSLELAHAHQLQHCKMAAGHFVVRRFPKELVPRRLQSPESNSGRWVVDVSWPWCELGILKGETSLRSKGGAERWSPFPQPLFSLTNSLLSLPVFPPSPLHADVLRTRTNNQSASLALGACGLLRALLVLLPWLVRLPRHHGLPLLSRLRRKRGAGLSSACAILLLSLCCCCVAKKILTR